MAPSDGPPQPNGGPGRLKVGELAHLAGLTVRTLHHYEEVGLLEPAGRTGAGHRYYGPAELRRLHRIVALRQLGLTLDEIGRALEGRPESLALARRARDLVEAFTGGDPEIHASLERLYRLEGPDQVLRGRGVPTSPELWSYMQEARRCLETLEADPA